MPSCRKLNPENSLASKPIGSLTWRLRSAASDSSSTSANAWRPSWDWLPEKVDPDRPLHDLGLDSLTAMDLKVEIEACLGTALPLSMLLESVRNPRTGREGKCAPRRHSGRPPETPNRLVPSEESR